MKKQVTFAQNQTVRRLHQDEASPRTFGMNQSNMALNHVHINFSNGLKIKRPPAARSEPPNHTAIQIPTAMTAAPFLKHAALTPAQKEYLYTIAASYSGAHVRSLITQHYMNVLHRCTRAGCNHDRDDLVVSSVGSPENERTQHQSKTQPGAPSGAPSRAKHKEKMNTGARHPGKSFLPQIPNRQARPLNAPAWKHKKMKTGATTSRTLRRQSPTRARISLLDEEEDGDEEGLDDTLSLSSLSLGEWDDDFLDL